jgi:hypothetical protein
MTDIPLLLSAHYRITTKFAGIVMGSSQTKYSKVGNGLALSIQFLKRDLGLVKQSQQPREEEQQIKVPG